MNDDPRFSGRQQFDDQSSQPGGQSQFDPGYMNPDPSAMSFGEKLSLAVSLTKAHALTLFLVMLAGWLVIYVVLILGFGIFGISAFLSAMGGSTPSGGSIAFLFLGFLATSLVVGFLAQFFMIGVNSLVLCYADGERPDSVVATVMSPWSRFGSIVLCVLMWLLVNIVIQITVTVLGIIPILGWLAGLAVLILYSMAMFCALFYMADREKVQPVESVTLPFKMVTANFMTWFLAILTVIGAYIPAVLLMVVIFSVAGATNSIVVMFLAGLLCLALFVAVAVFAVFFTALTYRQTRGGFIAATGVF